MMDVVLSDQIWSFFRIDVPIHSLHRSQQCCATMDVRSGKLASTHQVLDEIPVSDTFSWNSLIHTHLSNGDADGALSIYQHMLLRGGRPDRRTLPRVLTASRLSSNLSLGKQMHGQALKLGFYSDQYIITALIEMYGRLDSVDVAKWLFDKLSRRNSVSWTILARLYLMVNKPNLAIDTFYQMVNSSVQIDPVALATAIAACGLLKSVKQGRSIHVIARKSGLVFDTLVSNSILKMYIDCNSIEDARATFDQMLTRDVISWTEIIGGYVKKGGFNEALKLFRMMNMDGVKPDSLSISSVLPACARMASHKLGKQIHGYMLRNGIDHNLMVQNAIVDMYVKSGLIEYASKVFERMKNRDVISWTVMVLGFSLHGQGERGVALFHRMKGLGVEADQFSYEAVLHSCTTASMVDEGELYFNNIKKPKVKHYALMVALLARAARFDEARNFIQEHQIQSHGEVLKALLDGCRIHQEANMCKQVIEQLCDLEPLNAENYVLLSNWYAYNAKWDMFDKLKLMIEDMGLKPMKAYSWIEFRNKVHVFGTGDTSHPRSESIYWELQYLMKKMEAEGHQPASVFSDVDEEQECIQIGHSEMLALSFGLISTQARAAIRITKNLCVCHSCHEAAKLISKIEERQIIIKDPNCFHHFKDGLCSCRDLW